MTTKDQTHGKVFLKGLSSDTKPTEKIVSGSEFYETDTGNTEILFGTTWYQTGTAGATNQYEHSLGAGDEGVGSPTLSRKRINNPAQSYYLDSAATAQNIGGAAGVPVYIKSILIMEPLTASAIVTIAGFSTPTLPAALANTVVFDEVTATLVDNYPLELLPGGIAREFPAGCQITCSTAGDALDVVVAWEAMP